MRFPFVPAAPPLPVLAPPFITGMRGFLVPLTAAAVPGPVERRKRSVLGSWLGGCGFRLVGGPPPFCLRLPLLASKESRLLPTAAVLPVSAAAAACFTFVLLLWSLLRSVLPERPEEVFAAPCGGGVAPAALLPLAPSFGGRSGTTPSLLALTFPFPSLPFFSLPPRLPLKKDCLALDGEGELRLDELFGSTHSSDDSGSTGGRGEPAGLVM